MDPTSAVRTDTLPAVATVLVPGALACAPYVALALMSLPDLATYLSTRELLATVGVALCGVAAGFTVESAGSYAEVYLIDRWRRDHKKMVQTWWSYLRMAWVVEPMGQRYLRRVMVSFKFELNMFTACIAAIPGVLLLWRGTFLGDVPTAALSGGLAITAALFFIAANSSADLLAKLRTELTREARGRRD